MKTRFDRYTSAQCLEIDATLLGGFKQFLYELRICVGGSATIDTAAHLLKANRNLSIDNQRATDIHVRGHVYFE
jgi:hypothetical protein